MNYLLFFIGITIFGYGVGLALNELFDFKKRYRKFKRILKEINS